MAIIDPIPPLKQPAYAREADGGEKPPTPHKKSRGRRRRIPLSPVEKRPRSGGFVGVFGRLGGWAERV